MKKLLTLFFAFVTSSVFCAAEEFQSYDATQGVWYSFERKYDTLLEDTLQYTTYFAVIGKEIYNIYTAQYGTDFSKIRASYAYLSYYRDTMNYSDYSTSIAKQVKVAKYVKVPSGSEYSGKWRDEVGGDFTLEFNCFLLGQQDSTISFRVWRQETILTEIVGNPDSILAKGYVDHQIKYNTGYPYDMSVFKDKDCPIFIEHLKYIDNDPDKYEVIGKDTLHVSINTERDRIGQLSIDTVRVAPIKAAGMYGIKTTYGFGAQKGKSETITYLVSGTPSALPVLYDSSDTQTRVPCAQKVMDNGRLLIRTENQVFSILGQEVR